MDQGCLGLSLERDQASPGGKARSRDNRPVQARGRQASLSGSVLACESQSLFVAQGHHSSYLIGHMETH